MSSVTTPSRCAFTTAFREQEQPTSNSISNNQLPISSPCTAAASLDNHSPLHIGVVACVQFACPFVSPSWAEPGPYSILRVPQQSHPCPHTHTLPQRMAAVHCHCGTVEDCAAMRGATAWAKDSHVNTRCPQPREVHTIEPRPVNSHVASGGGPGSTDLLKQPRLQLPLLATP